MNVQAIVVAVAILLTGIMAGIFFTWSNAVMPGIGKLGDLEFLQALKSMNRVILNKAFMAVFGGAMVAVFLVPMIQFNGVPKALFWFYVFTFVLYAVGVFGVTIQCNIPLNELLEGSNLDALSMEELKSLRTTIESDWNRYNLIRTVCASLTLICLIVSCFFWDK